MENKRNQETDYQSSLIIGASLLLIGLIAMSRNSDCVEFGMFSYFYAMLLFVRAYFIYNGKGALLNNF